jgi:hypothetical protein
MNDKGRLNDALKMLSEFKHQYQSMGAGYAVFDIWESDIYTLEWLIEQAKQNEYWRNQQKSDELESAYLKIQALEQQIESYKEVINLFKTAFANGDAEHRTINGRSVQAMELIKELEEKEDKI